MVSLASVPVASQLSSQRRLTIQTAEIATDTTTLRSLDWDRDRFDIEFGLQNGTTYNSYIIRGEKIALVDTSHAKFRSLYLDALQAEIDVTTIDYLVISHTEPDHSGLVKDVLALAPEITVVGAKVAIQFLEDLIHHPFKRQIVKNGDQIDLGNGHILQFVSAPNLHWPDTMLTYDHGTSTLFTCDVFGMHFCDDRIFDEDLTAIAPDYRFYYDCLMAPNARSVLAAMKRMDDLPTITTIATGHGPLLRHNLVEMTENYRTWSQNQTKGETNVAVFYVSDYGYSDRLSQAIAKGITKTGIAVEMLDLRSVDLQELREVVDHAAGIVVTPAPSFLESAQTAISAILGSAKQKQLVGIFESYGGDDQSIDLLNNRFKDLGLSVGFPLINIRETPTEATYQLCEESGTDLGQLLTRKENIKQIKALDADLDKAIGRLAGGLYIITAQKGELQSAMLASWVMQASFKPLGITIAVAKDRAIESFMHVGDRFVLNVLEEGNYAKLMQHFLRRFAPGADRFAGVKTQVAKNGSPILVDALAFLECEVLSRMEASDHWIVYATAEEGKVAKPDALTATHHRKVGNHY
ncbi:putative flavoprotein [Synechococcus sp. PCC 7502]|uniref:diflavin flavoprotein n=1 Tax=Synechococcus sp. PCC 7502 TaxID=1173263 RepID=UPI00029FD431|nr:diflavin flavoprotein [Synechococcus sp. PCC 7502]AFY72815.1 putative flavoprotein [Synechococcus sp. PCC 7502]